MKKLIFIPLACVLLSAITFSDSPVKNCKCKDIPLYGKVKVVEHYADFKVQITDSYPDLKVKTVEHYPNACGEWQFVQSYPDFTIQYVTHYPDFKIQFVTHYPDFKIQFVTHYPGTTR